MRIPTDARSGVAKALVSYQGAAATKVAPATIEFNVPLSQLEIDENQKRAERMRTLQKQIADLDEISHAKALLAGGDGDLLRRPIQAARNVDDFTPVSARFVRLTIHATADGSEPCLDELELYGPEGKVNLARVKGAKTTASSLLPGHAIHQIHHLTDGRHGNAWSWISGQRGAGWVQIELPAAATLSRVVWSRDAGQPTTFKDRVPSQYEIEVSRDGKDWTWVSSHAGRARTEVWFSELAEKHLNQEQRRLRHEWLKELKSLQP